LPILLEKQAWAGGSDSVEELGLALLAGMAGPNGGVGCACLFFVRLDNRIHCEQLHQGISQTIWHQAGAGAFFDGRFVGRSVGRRAGTGRRRRQFQFACLEC